MRREVLLPAPARQGPGGRAGLGLVPSLFLWRRYKAIVKYKTAFYSFYLPVAAAMYMVRVAEAVSGRGGPLVWGR